MCLIGFYLEFEKHLLEIYLKSDAINFFEAIYRLHECTADVLFASTIFIYGSTNKVFKNVFIVFFLEYITDKKRKRDRV